MHGSVSFSFRLFSVYFMAMSTMRESAYVAPVVRSDQLLFPRKTVFAQPLIPSQASVNN